MASSGKHLDLLAHPDIFAWRHVGPRPEEVKEMLKTLGLSSLDELMDKAIPASIRGDVPFSIETPRSETEVVCELAGLAAKNQIFRSYIGLGYNDCITPPVIQRNILENPGWYTQYTPYQAEISQGRLEALLNFQTMVADLTGMDLANASLLDEGTAAAEAMTLCRRQLDKKGQGKVFFVSERCHPQTIAVVKTRALPLGIEVVVGDHARFDFSTPAFGVLLQYPATDGEILDYGPFCEKAHAAGALVTVAADLLALALLRPPAEFGADVVIGNSQRFGVPLGFGGPHAAFMAVRDEFKRQMPGRIIGVSIDANGKPALRMALQTREQHIRRDRATSNICTAQVLLAVMASMYGVYHGPEGLKKIALRAHLMAGMLARALKGLGWKRRGELFFDTLRVAEGPKSAAQVHQAARAKKINLRSYDDGSIGVALDETVGLDDLKDLFEVFGGNPAAFKPEELAAAPDEACGGIHARTSSFMKHPVFHRYHSETGFQRYMRRLEARDLSLTAAMIPLGSCTMKLNPAASMFPITLPGFTRLHPFAPPDQARGYHEMIDRLGAWLCEITGFAGVSFMPNAGSAGEYTGLQTIRAYHHSRGDQHRNICLIPVSAHGTNPASAVMSGMKVVEVACDKDGNIDLNDLEAKAAQHGANLAALMVTYPSTHGVFEEAIKDICATIHKHGGQVYLDGANMNALVGVCRPADFGADVCHLNLHKTFAIPHGGGGPGVGPICVAPHLVPFLPNHPLGEVGGKQGIGPVAAAPYGSPSVLPIPYAYIAMTGRQGLRLATEIAVLNANYVAKKIEKYYPVVYKGKRGLVAHECIIDLRALKASADIDPDDVAKRLMDYGFHAPTMSWPVHGTLMVEPTESEPLDELDRFCEAMIQIREEIREIEEGRADRANNVLKHSPHTAQVVAGNSWERPYSRELAAFPTGHTRAYKFWPSVGRVDNVHGDRHLICTCPPIE